MNTVTELQLQFKEWPIWFVVGIDSDGNMTSLQEHDTRAGGHILCPEGKTWEDYFIEKVKARFSSPDVHQEARDFLAALKHKQTK